MSHPLVKVTLGLVFECHSGGFLTLGFFHLIFEKKCQYQSCFLYKITVKSDLDKQILFLLRVLIIKKIIIVHINVKTPCSLQPQLPKFDLFNPKQKKFWKIVYIQKYSQKKISNIKNSQQ